LFFVRASVVWLFVIVYFVFGLLHKICVIFYSILSRNSHISFSRVSILVIEIRILVSKYGPNVLVRFCEY